MAAAFTIGLLLPVLETIRRGIGHWRVEITTMLEDYLAGALLVLAGLTAVRGASFAKPLLLIAWAAVASMMTISLISQIEDTARAVALEPNHEVVLAFKFLLWSACLVALMRSYRQVREGPG